MCDRLPDHNVLALYRDADRVRRAISALELEGVGGEDISLLGPDVEEQAGSADTRSRDAEVVEHVGRRAATGAAAGTALGGAAGFLGGLVGFALPGVGAVIGAGVWAALAAGGVAGGAVGGILGGESALRTSEAWELVFGAVEEERFVLGVHSQDPGVVEAAAEVLEGTGPESIGRFDGEGARVG